MKNTGIKLPILEKPLLEVANLEKVAYDLCKKDYPGIIEIARLIIDRTKNNYDNQVSIEGVTGSGKSMFTYLLILVVHHILRRSFKIDKQTLFIPDEGQIRKEIKGLKELDVYWVDEAIRALDKKRWYNQDQIDLNHIIKTERWKKNTIIYNIQRFAEFTETFRNSNIYFRVIIIPRNYAVLRVSDIDPDVEDPWHTRETRSIKFNKGGRTRYKSILTADQRLKLELKAPNYHTYTPFPNLEQHPTLSKGWSEYLSLKQSSRDKMEEEKKQEEEKGLTKYDQKYKEICARILQQIHTKNGTNKQQIRKEYGLNLADKTFYDLFKLETSTKKKHILSKKGGDFKMPWDLA